MGRLTLDLPAALGRESGEEQAYAGDLDRATERFAHWFDCWARAGR